MGDPALPRRRGAEGYGSLDQPDRRAIRLVPGADRHGRRADSRTPRRGAVDAEAALPGSWRPDVLGALAELLGPVRGREPGDLGLGARRTPEAAVRLRDRPAGAGRQCGVCGPGALRRRPDVSLAAAAAGALSLLHRA